MNRKRLRTGDDKGAVLVLSVVGVVVAVICAALAVDLGRLAADKRDDQKVADIAALDAAKVYLPTFAQADAAAKASATRNNFPYSTSGYSLTTCLGTFGAADACVADAVNVSVKVQSPFKAAFPFVGGINHTAAKATAPIGGGLGIGEFSVGSTLAALDAKKTSLDPVLEHMLGLSAGKLSLVSYDGLATSTVSLNVLRTQLTSLGYTFSAGTATELLTTNIHAGDLLKATALALTADGNTTAAAELNKINFALVSTANVQIGRMLALSAPGSGSALSTRMNVYQLLTGTAQIANGTNFVSVPGVNVSVLGLYGVTTDVRVIEPAQTAAGPVDPYPFTIAKNSQVVQRLKISGITGVPSLNLDLTSANGKGMLKVVNCAASPSITIASNASAVSIGGVTNLTTLGVPVGTLTLNGSVASVPAPPDQTFAFKGEFVPPVGTGAGVSKRVGATNDLTPASLSVSGTGTGAALAPAVQVALNLILPALGPVLDPVLQPIMKSLGMELSAADLTAIDMSCGSSKLTA